MATRDPTLQSLASRLVALLDLTSLGDADTPGQIEALCRRARNGPRPAAVCIHPEHVTTARRVLVGTPVRVATVVNFPDGGDDPARVLRETRRAIAAGADEIDVVLPWASLLRGDVERARSVIVAARDACGAAHVLKLILETGELAMPARIRAAAELGIDAGVDFLKTSTGKTAVGATPEAAAVMLDVIAAHGGTYGFKVAGGVRQIEDARTYLALARERLGDAWITPQHFRIGASSLLDALVPLLASPP